MFSHLEVILRNRVGICDMGLYRGLETTSNPANDTLCRQRFCFSQDLEGSMSLIKQTGKRWNAPLLL